jgi:DNA replication protein DnaC
MHDAKMIIRTIIEDHFLAETEFIIDKHNERTVELLIMYFMGDTEFENAGNYSLKKGILLKGNVGTGKSLLIKAFKFLNAKIYRQNSFDFISAIEITKKYEEKGIEGINRYMKNPKLNEHNVEVKTPLHLCIDDIGTEETTVKHYGTRCSVIADVLHERYEIFTDNGKLTHITTNLIPKEIEELYGERVRSRMREMFNQIELTGPDRRN